MTRRALAPDYEHGQGRPLGDRDFDWLRAQGVPGPAVNWCAGLFSPLLLAPVVFGPRRRFDFARDIPDSEISRVTAYTVLLKDEAGDPLDVVAWHPRSGKIATWLGRAGLLGLEHPCACTSADPLVVFPDPLSWLAQHRRGVVVVEERLARPELLAVGALRTHDVAHGVALRAMLQKVRLPSILISSERAERSAA